MDSGGAMKKLFGRNCLMVGAFAIVLCLNVSCAHDPVLFTQPGVEIWNLNITVELGDRLVKIENQKMILIPSETEKDVYSVLAEISAKIDPPAGPWLVNFTEGKWTGEVKKGIFMGKTNRRLDGNIEGGSAIMQGSVKGTFSGTRASGTFRESAQGAEVLGKWTAEKIS
jgi:hypothetical protein